MTATYTGFVNSGLDNAGVFAQTGSDLSGDSFIAFFEYDTQAGLVNNFGTTHEVVGDAKAGFASPFLAAWAKVNGVTYQFGSASFSFAHVDEGQNVQHSVFQDNGNGGDLLNVALFPVDAPGSLETPFEADGPPGGLAGGGIIQVIPSSTPGSPATIFNLTVQHVSVAAAVPEPGSWCLMIVGFGSAGTVLRKRRRLAAPRST